MHKVIAIVAQNPELEIRLQKLKECDEHFTQRRDFLRKQLENLDNEARGAIKNIITETEVWLDAQGLMPAEYEPKNHHIHWDKDLGLVTLCDGSDHAKASPFEKLFEQIFRS